MPVYEYQCINCSKKFEIRRGFSEDTEVCCPECQGQGRRMFSPVTVIYKGSGFYTTDYGKSNSKAGEGNGTNPEKKEAKETKEIISEPPKAEAVKPEVQKAEADPPKKASV